MRPQEASAVAEAPEDVEKEQQYGMETEVGENQLFRLADHPAPGDIDENQQDADTHRIDFYIHQRIHMLQKRYTK
jgi:hypothetical protein